MTLSPGWIEQSPKVQEMFRDLIGQSIILEVEGGAGRSNAVGHGVYQGDGSWYFDGDDRVGAWEGLLASDRVVRWAHYPEPSWREPL